MIVETAAKINAMKFFTIIFSTPVGRNVFKSFKDEELLLEEVARENGNEELACFLEERHLMYVWFIINFKKAEIRGYLSHRKSYSLSECKEYIQRNG